jgi:hypothetical protein
MRFARPVDRPGAGCCEPRADEALKVRVRQAREEWTATRQPKMRLEPHRLVFLDEAGTTTKMTRLRGRCPKGQRLRSKAPFGHWKTQTFIAGLRCEVRQQNPIVDSTALNLAERNPRPPKPIGPIVRDQINPFDTVAILDVVHPAWD